MHKGHLAVLLVALAAAPARAERWVGPASSTGSVAEPASYLQAVQHLARDRYSFEDLAPGTSVNRQNLGRFGLLSLPNALTNVIAERDLVAGALPSSGRIALHVTQAISQPTTLALILNEPVISVGFVLMGVESQARLQVYGGAGGTDLLGDYAIAAGTFPGLRRWVGVSENDRVICKIVLTPDASEDYALDDVELGVHTPEPCLLAGWLVLLRRPRRHWNPSR